MITLDHLTLHLVRLKQAEPWPATEPNLLSLVFIKGGAGEFTSKTFSQNVFGGDVLAFSGSPGIVLAPQKGELVFWCFSASIEHLLPLFLSSEISQLQFVSQNLRASRYYPASTQMATECHRLVSEAPAQFDLKHRSHLLKIAALVLAEEFKVVQKQRAGFVTADEHMIQVFEKLSTEELLNLSVGDLAARFGCSRRHLNRLFHSYFGVSVAALRMELRLLKAVTLLRDRDTKIINVAESCGFNHLGLFNTCFKRRFGVSPGRWREKVGGQNGEPFPEEVTKLKRGAKASSCAVPIKQTKPAKAGDEAASSDPSCPLRLSGLCPWADPGLAGAPSEKKTRQFGNPSVFMGMASTLGKTHKPNPPP